MRRLLAWCGVAALATCAWILDSDVLRGACAFAVIALLGIGTPRSLRRPFWVLLACAATLQLIGGTRVLLDALPMLFAGIVAWLFARTLLPGRTPLIARAIAAIDGAGALAIRGSLAYARRLTALWAAYQLALALLAAAVFFGAHAARDTVAVWLPSPRVFGALILPAAVASLLVGEFLLRPVLLPQAPRRTLWDFLSRLVRVWPSLLDDGMIAGHATADG